MLLRRKYAGMTAAAYLIPTFSRKREKGRAAAFITVKALLNGQENPSPACRRRDSNVIPEKRSDEAIQEP
jgi:hypothetical protein